MDRSNKMKNPIAAGFDNPYKDAFRHTILPQPTSKKYTFKKKEAQLYLGNREWLVKEKFVSKDNSRRYEEYLDSLFWTPPKRIEEHRHVIFLLGQRGCGKSTLIDYYLRCYCPSGRIGKKYYDQKIVISVDVKNVPTTQEFDKIFYKSTFNQIQTICKNRKIKCDLTPGQMKDYEVLVELHLEDFAEKIHEGFPAETEPFKYIVLCIDNLDQSPVEIQEYALRIVKNWLESTSKVELWQVYLPFWPDTFEHLVFNEKILIPPEDYHEIELGHINCEQFLTSRVTAMWNTIEADGNGVVYEGENNSYVEENNDSCVRFIKETIKKIDQFPGIVKLVRNIAFGNLRYILDIWHSFFASDTMFYYYRNIGYQMVSRYQLKDSIITGFYRFHNKKTSRILNLYNIIREAESERDLLIGPHLLFLLQRKINSYEEIFNCLEDLGYTRKKVNFVLDVFRNYNLFHLSANNSNDKLFEIHTNVIDSYTSLYTEDVYIDNMAMTSQVDQEVVSELKQTVSYLQIKFTNRVETTIKFIEQIRKDENDFRLVSKRPSLALKNKFKNRLKEIKFPILWKQIALSYYQRLKALSEGNEYLQHVENVTEEWWDKILYHDIFVNAKSSSNYLTPIDDESVVNENDNERPLSIITGPESKVFINKGEHMRDKYVAGQAGAQGPNSNASDMNFIQVWNKSNASINLENLAEEIGKLRRYLKEKAKTTDHDIIIGNLAIAENFAKEDNGPKVLEWLSKTGKWVFDAATQIGVRVAATALKVALGLS